MIKTFGCEANYYFPNDGMADRIFGDQEPCCINEGEVKRLSAEWGIDLFEIMHEATDEEMKNYFLY